MTKREIKCPQCGHLTFYSSDNLFRPFCSERCRLLDLGEWASESYTVSHANNDETHDMEEVEESHQDAHDEDGD